MREGTAADDFEKISHTVGGTSQGANFSTLISRLARSAQQWNNLSVIYAAMNPPQCAAGSHKLYVSFLREMYFSTRAYSKYLGSGGEASDYQRETTLNNRASSEFMAWSYALQVTARRLDVRIPFPIPSTPSFGASVVGRSIPSTSATSLRWVSPPGGSYSVMLPANWVFRNASYPSDHYTNLWYAPGDVLSKLEVVGSGDVGAVSVNANPGEPYPQGDLPTGVTTTHKFSRWVLGYQAYTNDDPYPDNGLIVILHPNGEVNGYVRADLWLRSSEHALATTILNSFKAGD